VLSRPVEVGKVFELRWMPIDAVSAKDETTRAGRRRLNGKQLFFELQRIAQEGS
jgi:hypothetical protein